MTKCSAHISPDSTLHTDWYNLFDSCEAASEIIFSIFDVDFVESHTFLFCRFVSLFLILNVCALEKMGWTTFSMVPLQSFLKGFLRLIKMQHPSDSVLCGVCLLSTYSAFIMYGVCSAPALPPISLFTHSVFLSTDSAFPGMLDSPTCSDTHMHWLITGRKSRCLFRTVPVFPLRPVLLTRHG